MCSRLSNAGSNDVDFSVPTTISTDSTNAFLVQKSNGSDVFQVDTVTGKVIITGDLDVSENITQTTINEIKVADPLIKLGDGNAGDTYDLGWYSQYVSSGTKYAGLVRKAGSDFSLFSGLTSAPTATSVGSVSSNYANLNLYNLTATNQVLTDTITERTASAGLNFTSAGNIVAKFLKPTQSSGTSVYNYFGKSGGECGVLSYYYDAIASATKIGMGISGNPFALSVDGNSNTTTIGCIYSIDGSASVPTYSFTNDIDTGIYSAGPDSIGFATAGAKKMTLDSTGQCTVGTASDLSSSNNYKLTVINSGSDSNPQRLCKLLNTATKSSSGGASMVLWQDDGTAMTSGNRLGYINFAGSKDTSHGSVTGASIDCYAEETFTGSQGGSGLRFSTCTTGTTTNTERMRIDYLGNVGIGTINSSTRLNVDTTSSANVYGLGIGGTMSKTGADLRCCYIAPIITPSNGYSGFGMHVTPTFTSPASGFVRNYGLVVSNANNGSGTVYDSYGVYIDPVSKSSGTVDNAWGLRVENPTAGTSNYCAYFAGNVGVGGVSTDSVLNVSITSSTRLYGLTVNGTLSTVGRDIFGVLNQVSLSRANGYSAYAHNLSPTFTSPTGGTTGSNYAMLISSSNAGSGTTQDSFGLYISPVTKSAGTVNYAWGLYVKNPTAGTNNYCGFFEGNLGVGATPSYPLTVTSSTTSHVAYVGNTTESSAGHILRLDTDTSAGTGFNFLQAISDLNGPFDTEFILRGDGSGYCDGSWNGGGADYAEYFESKDGSALEKGRCVILDGSKIRYFDEKTDNSDDILGVIRPKSQKGVCSIIGNTAWNSWNQKYLTDDFGDVEMEDYTVYEWHIQELVSEVKEEILGVDEVRDPETDRIITPAKAGSPAYPAQYKDVLKQWADYKPLPVDVTKESILAKPDLITRVQQKRKINPAYDPDLEYVPRENRPEWNIVGLLGQIPVKSGEPIPARWKLMKVISAPTDLSAGANMYLVR